ncbi:MAG: hypothetical protein SFZ03_12080 [Candidatus Melainabacteria bacterium]|nr:hypothetical protein [Candidatus Melainabacteria bacterium]
MSMNRLPLQLFSLGTAAVAGFLLMESASGSMQNAETENSNTMIEDVFMHRVINSIENDTERPVLGNISNVISNYTYEINARINGWFTTWDNTINRVIVPNAIPLLLATAAVGTAWQKELVQSATYINREFGRAMKALGWKGFTWMDVFKTSQNVGKGMVKGGANTFFHVAKTCQKAGPIGTVALLGTLFCAWNIYQDVASGESMQQGFLDDFEQ